MLVDHWAGITLDNANSALTVRDLHFRHDQHTIYHTVLAIWDRLSMHLRPIFHPHWGIEQQGIIRLLPQPSLAPLAWAER